MPPVAENLLSTERSGDRGAAEHSKLKLHAVSETSAAVATTRARRTFATHPHATAISSSDAFAERG
eukprot:7594883-Pyramimonas_sp.AAC.1